MSKDKKIDPSGFREYDARWIYPKNINDLGIESVGKGFGTQVKKKIDNPNVIVGYDYRSYSEKVKENFVKGLISNRMQCSRYWFMLITHCIFFTI